MKKMAIILMATFTQLLCVGQTNREIVDPIAYPVTVGLGVLEFSFDNPVPLYRTENDSICFDVLKIRQDRKTGVWHYETEFLTPLAPYRSYGGNSYESAEFNRSIGLGGTPPKLSFRVLDAYDDYFRVVIDEESFRTAVIRKDPDYAVLPQCRGLFGIEMPQDRVYKGYYAYETWEHLLERAEFIELNRDNGMIYDSPDGNMIYDNANHKFLPYNVTDVCGHWIKVKKGRGREFNFTGIENAEGWARWGDETRFLVEIMEYTID